MKKTTQEVAKGKGRCIEQRPLMELFVAFKGI